MFVKICGFTGAANLATICAANVRPDAIGLNFWPGSKRYVWKEADGGLRSAEVREAGAAGLAVWGVFVNADAQDLGETPAAIGLAGVQLHGDEPPERLASARLAAGEAGDSVVVVRAWRVGRSLDPLREHLAAVHSDFRPNYVLLDAAVPGAYGGTGAKLDWHALRGELDRVGPELPPVILAGGLTPGNVAEAVRIVRPWGVDAAGGVESSPGIKDPARVAAFCDAARSA